MNEGPGLLPFNLGSTQLITHYHTVLQYIELDDIDNKLNTVRKQIASIEARLDNYTYGLYEIQIEYLVSKVDRAFIQLKSLEPGRAKRGLVNALGSVIKSISGNLDYNDALKYDDALNILKKNQDKIVANLNHHISLSKDWMAQHTNITSKIVENEGRINQTIKLILDKSAYADYNLIKFAKLGQLIDAVGDNVDDLLVELRRIEDILAFTRSARTHHLMLDLDVLSNIIRNLESIYRKDQLLDLELREYYDIIKTGSYFKGKQIVIAFKIPIISSFAYQLYQLCTIPNRNGQVLIPPYPLIATNGDSHVYIEAECPKVSNRYLCEEKLNSLIRTEPDCITRLLRDQVADNTCTSTVITLAKEAMEKLDDRHYAVIFPHPTRVKLTCGRDEYTTLNGSYLATIPHNCMLRANEFTIVNSNDKLKGRPMKILQPLLNYSKTTSSQPPLKILSIDLKGLHDLQHRVEVQPAVIPEEIHAVYHTTIPMYVILLISLVLYIAHWSRRYLRHRSERHEKQPTAKFHVRKLEAASTSDEFQEDLPATFSMKILK